MWPLAFCIFVVAYHFNLSNILAIKFIPHLSVKSNLVSYLKVVPSNKQTLK